MIIVDTGAFVALLDCRDTYHERAKQCFSKINEPLVTTYPVITEACFLLTYTAKCKFLRTLSVGAVEIAKLEGQHIARMLQLIEQYADLPMDFVDASLFVFAEMLQEKRIITVDRRDFSVYRWNHSQPFENVLFPV